MKLHWNSCRIALVVLFVGLATSPANAKDGEYKVKALKAAGIDMNEGDLRAELDSDAPLPRSAGAKYEGVLILEDFSDSEIGKFPKRWRPKGKTGKEFYVVAEENGNKYLKADAIRAATSIFRKVKYDLREYPVMEWRWRPRVIPENSNERKRRSNDSTLGLYIVFPLRFFLPDSLKYLWSRVLPVGDEFKNGSGRNRIQVLQSGDELLGKWVVERRNILDDFERRFNKKGTKKSPIGIGVITDGDQTKSLSSGDYDDFRIMTLAAAQKLKPGFAIEPVADTDMPTPPQESTKPALEIEILDDVDASN